MGPFRAMWRHRAWVFVPLVLIAGLLALLWLSGEGSTPGIYLRF